MKKKLNKSDLTRAVADHTGMKQTEAGKAVDAVLDNISKALKQGDEVALAGFGTFVAKTREAREGRNPLTKETIKIPKRTSAAFKPAAALKDL
ncbi:DNA-binding protein [bacterium]|nr:DNA-binding protein [bacterium]